MSNQIQIESPRVFDANRQPYTMADCIFDVAAVKRLEAELAAAREDNHALRQASESALSRFERSEADWVIRWELWKIELAAVRAEVERASKLNSEETIVLPTARLSPASSGSP